jgi:hypothetical protein
MGESVSICDEFWTKLVFYEWNVIGTFREWSAKGVRIVPLETHRKFSSLTRVFAKEGANNDTWRNIDW